MILPAVTSPLLSAAGVHHAFFTRQGGVSRGIYDSLNVGSGSGDDPADVTENRRRCAAHFGLAAEDLATCFQIHSARACVAERSWADARPEADAVVTSSSGVICGALSADCAPILMADPQAQVVGAVHAGWKGALDGVIAGAVAEMVRLGARPDRMLAAVGPCIGQASYEVGLEFLERFVAANPQHADFFGPGRGPEKRQFDLPGFVLARLRAAGVGQCEWTGHDTCADETRFFSNRRAFQRGERDYGRLLSAIVLR